MVAGGAGGCARFQRSRVIAFLASSPASSPTQWISEPSFIAPNARPPNARSPSPGHFFSHSPALNLRERWLNVIHVAMNALGSPIASPVLRRA